MGDGSLIGTNRDYLKALQNRVAQLKREGKTVDETVQTVTTEFRAKYPDWTGNAGAAARGSYSELK